MFPSHGRDEGSTPSTRTTDLMSVKFQTNLNTELLKVVAVVAMTLDHISVLVPEYEIPLRWIGRLAFPLFCYCMTVGMVYTRDINKYLMRLGIFALIAQPLYTMAFYWNTWQQNWWELNILFTLFFSLTAMWGLKEKHFILSLTMITLLLIPGIDDMLLGLVLMMVFYYCRERRGLGAILYILLYVVMAIVHGVEGGRLDLRIGDVAFGFEIFALAAMPLIFIKKPRSKWRINKWFFYAYYPTHLCVIALMRLLES